MLKVIVVGLGPIGAGVARAVMAEAGLELVGMVDVDPEKVGRTAEQVRGEGDESGQESEASDARVCDCAGPRVTESIDEAVAGGADVAVLTTSSRFDEVVPTVEKLLAHKLAVVSSCEQMVWPWYRHAALADALDDKAKQAGRAVLGTGVNPGFVMDSLAVTLASMVRRVRRVRCVRRVDCSLRRKPLQRKIGVTTSPQVFQHLAGQGRIGHAGLAESAALLAAGLSRKIPPGSIEETLEPVLAVQPTPSALGVVAPGQVAGVHHLARWKGDGLELELDLTMAVGLPDPKDKIIIDGPVRIHTKIGGAIPGDSATVAAVLNQIRNVHRAQPGLRTMIDIPPCGCASRDG